MSDDPADPHDLVTAGVVAKRTGLSERHVRRLTADGELPHYRVGRAVRYRLADVEQFLEERRRVGRLVG